jgi:hypothetical protein
MIKIIKLAITMMKRWKTKDIKKTTEMKITIKRIYKKMIETMPETMAI